MTQPSPIAGPSTLPPPVHTPPQRTTPTTNKQPTPAFGQVQGKPKAPVWGVGQPASIRAARPPTVWGTTSPAPAPASPNPTSTHPPPSSTSTPSSISPPPALPTSSPTSPSRRKPSASRSSAPGLSFARHLRPHVKPVMDAIEPLFPDRTDGASASVGDPSKAGNGEVKEKVNGHVNQSLVESFVSIGSAVAPASASTPTTAPITASAPNSTASATVETATTTAAPPTAQLTPTPPRPKPKTWAALLRQPPTPPVNNTPNRSVKASTPGAASPSASVGSLPPPAGVGTITAPSVGSAGAESPRGPPPEGLAPVNGTLTAKAEGGKTNGTLTGERKLLLGEKLDGVETQFEGPYLYPRGLVNNGNICFANAILQVLLHCGPFYNLLRLLSRSTTHSFNSQTPLLDAMIEFISAFHPVEKSELDPMRDDDDDDDGEEGEEGKRWMMPLAPPVEWVESFVAESVWAATRGNGRFDAMRRGQQEDAQEFLGFFLDSLHEELLLATERHDKSILAARVPNGNGVPGLDGGLNGLAGAKEDDEWMEVGTKGRAAVTRSTDSTQSAITRIFGLQTRSVLHRSGQKDSVTFEPNNAIQLDISPPSIRSIEDALAHLCVPDVISDMTGAAGIPGGGRVVVSATKQMYIESWPPVLVLHLKRFLYDEKAGIRKSGKVISYATELEIPEACQTPSRRGKEKIKYRLFAVVYHHGLSATGGHYTVSLRQHLTGTWIYVDDTHIRATTAAAVSVDAEKVAKAQRVWGPEGGEEDKSAYLLLYTRR